MSGIGRKTTDSAGGVLTEGSSNVSANGQPVVRHGDAVASHGIAPHDAPTMIAGSNNVFCNGKAVVNEGDLATCGHAISGSSDVLVG